MPNLSDAQKAFYLADEDHRCPFCGAAAQYHEEQGDRSYEGLREYQRIRCVKCGNQWEDEYALYDDEYVTMGVSDA